MPPMSPPLTEPMMRMVRAQRLGYVASVAEDGAPMVSPKGSLTVWDDTHLVFADIDSPHTVKNLARNPRTEVNVVDPFLRKGYRFTGTAKVLHTGAIYWKVLERYKAEGADIRRIRAVVLIEVAQASALVSPVYAAGFSEDEVGRLWEEFHTRRAQKTVLDLTPPSDF
ncbi:MAG TPA: pyridoxamine 5'-phosphate oxidase family protein [Thermoplasmata archaeon]|nr:pyridoxamine 5'-phosphate oxidase family protein [Thermoplasmata archaeon]